MGSRPEIRFEWQADQDPPSIEVFTRSGYIESPGGEEEPKSIATIPTSRGADGVCFARLEADMPDGALILRVRDRDAPAVQAVIGLFVDAEHRQFIASRIAAREARSAVLYATASDGANRDAPLFSIATTVYDTPAAYVEELARCLKEQLCGDFEWLLLDNGSSDPDTRDALAKIAAADPRVRLFRVEENIHIIPGNRYLFDRAQGRYVVPVDSDDIVYRDALALFRSHIESDGQPEILFSEECKLLPDGEPIEHIWRPCLSLLHAFSTCPAAHLMAFDRRLGVEADVYADDYARGSHDWDTMLRLLGHGARAVRVPHILYGWRMHEMSSAANPASKDYLAKSQRAVLERALARAGLSDRLTVEAIAEDQLGFFRIRRARTMPRPVAIDLFVSDATERDLDNLGHNLAMCNAQDLSVRVVCVRSAVEEQAQDRIGRVIACSGKDPEQILEPESPGRAASEMPDGVFAKILVDNSLRLQGDGWIWDVVGALELDPGTGLLGGLVTFRDGLVQHAGYFTGLDGFVATPCFGQPSHAIRGRLAQIARGVTAVYGGLMAVRPEVVARVGGFLDVDRNDGIHGLEFSLRCRSAGIGVGFTPALSATRSEPLQPRIGLGHPLRDLIRVEERTIHGSDPFYSPLLSRDSALFGQPARGASAPPSSPEVAALTAGPSPLDRMLMTMNARARRWVRSTGYRVLSAVKRRRPVQVAAPPAAAGLPNPTPIKGLLAPAEPLNLRIDPRLSGRPTLNVLLPGIAMESMSGGPNTIYNLCYRMAAEGVPVRFFSTGLPMKSDLTPIWNHVMSLAGIDRRLDNVEFVDASDRGVPAFIGANDVFMATAWWTAQMVKYALRLVNPKRFLYLIQDFEPVLDAHSTPHALALETYGLDFVPFVNHPFLAQYFREQRIGRFADAAFADRCTVIDPAIDRTRFFPQERGAEGKRRLLFYARPITARRNLFELGVAALREAAMAGAFDSADWEILAMGDAVGEVELGRGQVLRPAPWQDFDGYAAQMRSADVLLSLMLSPHPSYPPLEMAACGGFVVTNRYANKTPESFATISPRIFAPDPTVEGIGRALVVAAERACSSDDPAEDIPSPASWSDAFAPVLPRAVKAFHDCQEVIK